MAVTYRKAKAKDQKKGSQMCLEKGQLRAVHRGCDLKQHRRQFGTHHLDAHHRQGRDRRKSANDVRAAVRNAETAPTAYAQCSDACEQQVAITRIM